MWLNARAQHYTYERKKMKRRLIALLTAAALALALPTAAFAASPRAQGVGNGLAIQQACGASMGQLIGPAKKAGNATHGNYAGGAKALVGAVGAHCA